LIRRRRNRLDLDLAGAVHSPFFNLLPDNLMEARYSRAAGYMIPNR